MPMFVGSQSFISLPSFMFVSAVVSEIRELKEKEKEKEYMYYTHIPYSEKPRKEYPSLEVIYSIL